MRIPGIILFYDNIGERPHILRYSFASRQLENEIDLRCIQEFPGYSSIITTEIYTHVSNKNPGSIKNPLDEIFEDSS